VDKLDDALLDLTALAMFRAVVHERGVTRAAARLQRVQSNITTRIRQLERTLGTSLFTRTGRRMVLTPEGERLLPYAEQLLELAGEARRSLGEPRPQGRLRLGAMPSLAVSALPHWLGQYRRRWLDVSVELTIEPPTLLLERLRRFELDAVLVAQSGDADEFGRLASEVVARDELVLVTDGDHPPVRYAADLRSTRMVSLARGCAYRRLAQGWLMQGGVRPREIIDVDSYHALFAWIAAGTAYGFAPRSTVGAASRAETVQVHALGSLFTVNTALVWREAHSPRALDAFRAMLIEARQKS
jgi:DNA-binding transcriptional LysR family regulator